MILMNGAELSFDPSEGSTVQEMYADVDARGGILEPPGIVEVKYRAHQQALQPWLLDGVQKPCWLMPNDRGIWTLLKCSLTAIFVAFVMGMATPSPGFRQTNSWPPINFTGGSHAPHRWEVDEVGCALRSCQCWGEAEHSEGDQGMEQWRMLHGVRWLQDGFSLDLAWIEDGFGMEFGMDSGSRLTNNGAIQQVHLNPCDLLILGTAWSRIGGYSGLRDIYEGWPKKIKDTTSSQPYILRAWDLLLKQK